VPIPMDCCASTGTTARFLEKKEAFLEAQAKAAGMPLGQPGWRTEIEWAAAADRKATHHQVPRPERIDRAHELIGELADVFPAENRTATARHRIFCGPTGKPSDWWSSKRSGHTASTGRTTFRESQLCAGQPGERASAWWGPNGSGKGTTLLAACCAGKEN